MARYNVHAGHNPDGKVACGAVGLIKESTEARKVKDEVIRLLRLEGHTVYDTTVNDGTSASDVLYKIVKKCNANKVDLDISIHFNSGAKDNNGDGVTTGCEVFGYDTNAKPIGDRICSRISTLDYNNRGFKVNPDLYVLKNTISQAILIECCFVDDRDDVSKYVYKIMAKAIAEGILNKAIIEEVYDMDKLVVYYGDADVFAAIVVAQKYRCPLMKKNDFDASGLKAKEIIQIGGKKEDTDRFVTFKNASKYL